MKNTYLLILILSSYNLLGQTEVPIEDYQSLSAISGEKNGIYFKDVNGIFTNYLGVWSWTDGNKEIVLNLYKDENVPITYGNINFSRDQIYGYYIYKENGIELINTKSVLQELINERQDEARGGIGMIPINDGFDSSNIVAVSFADYSRRACIDGIEVPVSGSPGYWKFSDENNASVGLYTAGTIYSNCEMNILYPNFPANETIDLVKIANEAPPLD